ncbi:MAG: 16S rRNA (adenine(1518)-N(6)/adenine(1519)-N(6))-dimethyltransferase RsmA [Puniceicoccales bacterium]|jgi:16S rRNA (adenine1518-N6/adenine1519-N6)-dimethyltransferase|nr:16S rRNA (adenine(1518)-N(6)/adenine(1519)-N(6))-dimethyltransferase RsmA [Puniceicoccales bacterium]
MAASSVQSLLSSLALRPAKALGQNFLCDGNMAKVSVAMAQLRAGDRVVEIGPGLGALTEQLLAAGTEVHAVEIDGRLWTFLEKSLAPRFPGKFFLMRGDAVEFPFGDLCSSAPDAVVSNLPYAITGPWLDALLRLPLPSGITLLLQLEAIERLSAPIHSRRRCAMGVRMEAAFRIRATRKVPPQCFFPRPAVQSAIVHFRRLDSPHTFSGEALAVMRHCFQMRRKQVGTSCRAIGDEPLRALADRWLTDHGAAINPKCRPEDLTLGQWLRLEELRS